MPALTSAGEVAPGAENVGQARILTQFAPAFEMGDLFKGADAGAVGDEEMAVEDDAMTHEVDMNDAAYVSFSCDATANVKVTDHS